VSCSLNQSQLRHNALRNALADALKAHHVQVCVEVPIGGARRPVDLALEHMDPRGPLAIDLVVHHPLSLSENRSSDLARTSLRNAEKAKLREYEDLCHGNGWLFTPMGWHPWAGLGLYGAALRMKVEKKIAGDLKGWPRRNLIQAFRADLSFALMNFIWHQRKAADDALLEAIEECLMPPAFEGGAVFTEIELSKAEAEEEEPVFCGPIRIRATRPHQPTSTGNLASVPGVAGYPPGYHL